MWENLKKLFGSKKYQSALGVSLAGIVYAVVGPKLGADVTPDQIQSIIDGIIWLFSLAIGGNTVEDAFRNLKNAQPKGTKK